MICKISKSFKIKEVKMSKKKTLKKHEHKFETNYFLKSRTNNEFIVQSNTSNTSPPAHRT